MALACKCLCLITTMLFLGLSAPGATARQLNDVSTSMAEKHEQWMAKYGKVYKNEAEKAARFKIFKENLEFIESANRGGERKYKLGVNSFTDMTNEEFQVMSNGFRPAVDAKATSTFMYENVTDADAPDRKDWRDEGAVTPVKNQAQCGSCWAFSSVAATEGIHKIKTGNLISLSEQELLDCKTGPLDGCVGGTLDGAFEFIVQNGGLATEDSYPYRAAVGSCDNTRSSAASISGYEKVPVNETALLAAVANQPVSVGILYGSPDFKHYAGGVFGGPCGNQGHGVTLVGYGTESDGTKYWLAKNSWGVDWGEEGYMKMARDTGGEGTCGLARFAYYPIA